MKTKATKTSTKTSVKNQAQTPTYTLEQIHETLVSTGIQLLAHESAAETLRGEIERVILFLKEKKIRLTQRVNRVNPEKGCHVLSFVAIRADSYYRGLRIEKSMAAGMNRQQAEKEADSASARKSIQQLSNNLVCRIRASVSTGRWLSKQEYQKLAAKKVASNGSKNAGKTGKAKAEKAGESGKTTADKIRIALNTIIQMVQNDEQPIGYDPVEIIASLKEALDCID